MLIAPAPQFSEYAPVSSDATSTITINGRRIGRGKPVYIIAEMSANHGQNFEQARSILHAAKAAGADAVKLQTLAPDGITLDCDNPCFQLGGDSLWAGRTLYDLYREAQMPWQWHSLLKTEANTLGMDLFSSPFDHQAVEFLQSLDMPAYKIASFEIVDLPLIRRAAQTGRPLIISTGMADETEIAEALCAARQAGACDVALLKCTSAYPAHPKDMNLRGLERLAQTFDVPVGLSDHTLGIEVPIAAVALGACIVEKHLTLSRDLPGPDSAFSLEPDEFQQMVSAIRVTSQAMGRPELGISAGETGSLLYRRSLFAVEAIRAGERFTIANVRIIRPGHGLPPRHLEEVLGQTAKEDIPRGTPLNWRLLGK